MSKVKVLLVDDLSILRLGIVSMFEDHPSIEIVGEASNGKEALEVLQHETVDVVIMDIDMPVMDGIEATALVKNRFPSVKVLIYSSEDDYEVIIEAVKAGVEGYLLKTEQMQDIERAIKTIVNGKNYLSEKLTQTVIVHLFQNKESLIPACETDCELSSREREILTLILSGQPNIEIARQLSLSKRTVETHRYRMMKKIGANNTAGLFHYALENRLI